MGTSRIGLKSSQSIGYKMPESNLYVHGPQKNFPKNTVTLGEYFVQRLEDNGDKVAQIIELDGKIYTLKFSEILHSGKVMAGLLRKHGLKPGDTVMSVTSNTLEYAPIMWGTLFVGAAIAPVNPLYELSDMVHLITTIKPQVIVSNKRAESCLRQSLTQYGGPTVVFVTVAEMYKYLKDNKNLSGFYIGKVEDPDTHVATVLCTSGTAGKPKCVEMGHTMIIRSMEANQRIPHQTGNTDQQAVVNIAGPYGVVGQIVNLIALASGTKCVLVPIETFNEKDVLCTLEKYKVTLILIGPCQLISLAKYADAKKYDLSNLKTVLVGGSPVSLAMYELAKNNLNLEIVAMYGMTETIRTSVGTSRKDKLGSVGTLVENMVAKIVEVETGTALGPNKEGELCIKHTYGFKCYRNDPAATAAAFDAAGFFHTGDIAYYDDDKFFFVVDRIKELIKYKNFHVPATDIEEVLLLHPAVSEAAVIGVYHETDWEHATAIVVKQPGAAYVTDKELMTLVESKLPKMKWLHGGVHFVSSLPKSLNGKIQKRELRAKYGAMPPDLPTIRNRQLLSQK